METAMSTIAAILVFLVALEHLYILVLEMFLWTTPRARKTFGTTPDFAAASKGLAANQGLYNGFLAAGLVWSLLHGNAIFAFQLKLFFLCCVLVAALYGALSVRPRIFVVQGVPALAALVAVLLFANPYGAVGSVTVAALQSLLGVF